MLPLPEVQVLVTVASVLPLATSRTTTLRSHSTSRPALWCPASAFRLLCGRRPLTRPRGQQRPPPLPLQSPTLCSLYDQIPCLASSPMSYPMTRAHVSSTRVECLVFYDWLLKSHLPSVLSILSMCPCRPYCPCCPCCPCCPFCLALKDRIFLQDNPLSHPPPYSPLAQRESCLLFCDPRPVFPCGRSGISSPAHCHLSPKHCIHGHFL